MSFRLKGFDIVDYTHSNHKELKEHIERAGIIIYESSVI